jgi:D-beta-D-heptose 7-phosphate kinase/D-beta-D-heptose 1-phosphate adenosyltransferase
MDKSLKEIIAAFPGKRVLIAGDVMLDEYIWGKTRRISPEAPVPVVEIGGQNHVPGGAANAAINVVTMGGEALLSGVVGLDRQGDWLTKELARNGLDTRGLVKDERRPTTTKTRVVAHGQQVLRLDREDRNPLSSHLERELLSWMASQVAECDACLLSDYAKGVVSCNFARRFIKTAREAGKPVIVDPKGADYDKYRGATLVKPNICEAERYANQHINDETHLLRVCFHMLETLGNASLLLTRGPNGMSLLRPQLEPLHIPSLATRASNVTGAGDIVASTLVMALAAKASLEEAFYLANMAAGIYVEKTDRGAVMLQELAEYATKSFSEPVENSESGNRCGWPRTRLSLNVDKRPAAVGRSK